jgi:glyoxylase-like metal-dependent hydrolase (beta-lactamase superfamily II)
MKIKLGILLAASIGVASPAAAQDAASFLEAADRAVGASSVNSISYSGSGWMGAVGQNFADGEDWPRHVLQSYDRVIDYPSQSSREEYVRVQGDYPARGGGRTPIIGERHTLEFAGGGYAWTLNGDGEPVAQSPEDAELAQFMIAVSPHGIIKSAMAADDVTIVDRYIPSQDRTLKVVAFTTMDKYRVSAEFNDKYLMERFMTQIPNPVMGDMQMEVRYEEWTDIGNGIKFPFLFHGHQGDHLLTARTGMNWLNLNVSEATANVADAALNVPANVRNAPAPQVNVAAQEVADGVWLMAGGSHNSVAIEFDDFVTVVDAPQNEARSLAVIAEINRLIPGKTIRYLINTHHHWDHLGGARTYVAKGATVVTHESNRDFYRDAVFAPQIRTLSPDTLSRNPFATTGPGPAALETVTDRHFISDGERTILIFNVQNLEHAADMLMTYLPEEQILINADLWGPPPAGAPPPANISASAVALYDNIRRLNLDIATHVPIHGQPGPHSDFERIVGPAAIQRQAALEGGG